ncbi:MAG: HDOD domain-containing protein [Planctomycetota bacterium]|nr:HDOD domain-containing protein [Planctomycetota bacterium]
MAALAIETASPTFLDELDGIPEIRPFPATASRLMAACQNPKSNCKQVAQIIECDPGLSVRLLRMTNSAMYGLRNEVMTVEHAVVVLGMRAVRDLAMSIAAAHLFADGDSAYEARQNLWHHSLGCATVARLLAKHVASVSADEAFLAGVFHDVGKLVFLDTIPDRYTKVTSGHSIQRIVDAEQNEFGITHQQLGMECGEGWGLSFEISEAIGFHHRPDEATEAQDLVSLTHLANGLSRSWGIGGEANPLDSDADALHNCRFSLKDEWLDDVREQSIAAFQESLDICSG